MTKPQKTTSTDFDSPWKAALEVYFEAFMAFCFPNVYADIDWSAGYEFLDNELQKIVPDSETGRRYADKLVKVKLKSRQPGGSDGRGGGRKVVRIPQGALGRQTRFLFSNRQHHGV